MTTSKKAKATEDVSELRARIEALEAKIKAMEETSQQAVDSPAEELELGFEQAGSKRTDSEQASNAGESSNHEKVLEEARRVLNSLLDAAMAASADSSQCFSSFVNDDARPGAEQLGETLINVFSKGIEVQEKVLNRFKKQYESARKDDPET